MYLSIIDVKPRDNYNLLLTFENNEQRIFDVSPYLEIGKFKELQDKLLFKTVKVNLEPYIRYNRII